MSNLRAIFDGSVGIVLQRYCKTGSVGRRAGLDQAYTHSCGSCPPLIKGTIPCWAIGILGLQPAPPSPQSRRCNLQPAACNTPSAGGAARCWSGSLEVKDRARRHRFQLSSLRAGAVSIRACPKVQTVGFGPPLMHVNMSVSLIHSVSADQQNALKVVRASKPRTRKSSKVMYCCYYCYYHHYYWCQRHTGTHRTHKSKLWGHFLHFKAVCPLVTERLVSLNIVFKRCWQLRAGKDGKLTPAARSGLFRPIWLLYLLFPPVFPTVMVVFKGRGAVERYLTVKDKEVSVRLVTRVSEVTNLT